MVSLLEGSFHLQLKSGVSVMQMRIRDGFSGWQCIGWVEFLNKLLDGREQTTDKA